VAIVLRDALAVLIHDAKINEVGHVMATTPLQQFGGANADTPYALTTVDLKLSGPMVGDEGHHLCQTETRIHRLGRARLRVARGAARHPTDAGPIELRYMAEKARDLVAERMTPAQITEAEKLAREWWKPLKAVTT